MRRNPKTWSRDKREARDTVEAQTPDVTCQMPACYQAHTKEGSHWTIWPDLRIDNRRRRDFNLSQLQAGD
jgi:hypothetical protein